MTEIIIVDDRVTNRNILHRLSAMLEPEAIIHSYGDPQSAIERIQDHKIDLIITDFKMPGMNGGEFIRYCRTNIPGFETPIIVVTAYEDREFRYEALEAGATEFLLSPIDHREFVTRVRNVLSLHRKSQELSNRAKLLESELDDSWALHAETVERSEKRLRSVMDSNPNPIFTTSSSGIITLANMAFAAFCGRTVEEMVDQPIRHVVPDSFFVERMLQGDEDVRHNRSATRGETKFRPAHGPETYMHVSKTTITGSIANSGDVLTVLTDITQRRAAEELLNEAKRSAEAANAAKSDFLANMSHELRTPLNAVIGFAELMKKESLGPLGNPAYHEYCEYIINGGQHLLAIISDVLDMAQIEAGKMNLKETPVQLQRLLSDTARLVGHRSEENQVNLVCMPMDHMPSLFVDEAKFRQVLVNVADNALKNSKEHGIVRIDARLSEDGGIFIDIEDNGIGMSEPEIELAFSRFGRVGPALLANPGAGLGLPLSVDLVRLHGGDLTINSKPGHGTKILIRLPPERVINDAEISERNTANADY